MLLTRKSHKHTLRQIRHVSNYLVCACASLTQTLLYNYIFHCPLKHLHHPVSRKGENSLFVDDKHPNFVRDLILSCLLKKVYIWFIAVFLAHCPAMIHEGAGFVLVSGYVEVFCEHFHNVARENRGSIQI